MYAISVSVEAEHYESRLFDSMDWSYAEARLDLRLAAPEQQKRSSGTEGESGASSPFCYQQERFNKLPNHGELKVLFVNSCFTEKAFEDELSTILSGEVKDLFSRMVKAMKLENTEYAVSAVSRTEKEEKSYLESLYQEIVLYKPRYVVSMGAKATRVLLQNTDRMTRIHGKFIDLNVCFQTEYFKTVLMPLFHPEFLLINPSMKKTAWVDMQNLMSHLG